MMTSFKIATWNVNSLRVRLPHVLTWLKTYNPDVLALQETKVIDDDFPAEAIKAAGYSFISSGQRAYNGVAILSRIPFEDVIIDIPNYIDPQRRLLAVSVGDIRILNLYVPNGQHVISPKYEYKLTWLKNLISFLESELNKKSKVIVLGDFNIAPEELDVHDPKRWEGKVMFSEPERAAFQSILKVGFSDSFRLIRPRDKVFTWWDYRLYARSKNLGLRIDHILISNSLVPHCTNCLIDKDPREWEKPSDHAPVLAEFNLN